MFNYVFETSDGMIFGIKAPEKSGESVIVIADVNGPKKPNKGTEDLRKYFIRNNGTLVDNTSDMRSWGNNNVEPLSECSSSNPSACTNAKDCDGAHGYWDGGECLPGEPAIIDDPNPGEEIKK